MLKLTGLLLLVAGTLAGVLLVLGPFGTFGFSPGIGMWLLFPFGLLIGSIVMALGSEGTGVPAILHTTGGILLALAGGAAVFLILPAFGVVERTGSMASIWFVLIVATLFGSLFVVTTGKNALKA